MLAITIVLFVVPHNQQIVTIQQFFTYRISLFRNQNLNIQKKTSFEIYATNSFKASIVLVYCSLTASNCCKANSKFPARKLSVISKLGLYK